MRLSSDSKSFGTESFFPLTSIDCPFESRTMAEYVFTVGIPL